MLGSLTAIGRRPIGYLAVVFLLFGAQVIIVFRCSFQTLGRELLTTG